jgi:hypothetical protein
MTGGDHHLQTASHSKVAGIQSLFTDYPLIIQSLFGVVAAHMLVRNAMQVWRPSWQ